ncbi:hypothetical protein PbJCM13498_33580 [Prolixibacter bellariivorans]|uniref:Uncharacterized protein n=1 Tax=Prolixibacter bellariivorans TaxID=314319 RepID=A0A5M4B2W1_9BACT|nr:hypothetical protein PbJCM13498_33580 [Prolixibacter bellariivorans]
MRKLHLYLNVLQTAQNTKYFQKPNHKDNDNNGIKNSFNSALHGNKAVYQPKDNPNDQNDNNDG